MASHRPEDDARPPPLPDGPLMALLALSYYAGPARYSVDYYPGAPNLVVVEAGRGSAPHPG